MDLAFHSWQEITNEKLESMIAANQQEERFLLEKLLAQLSIVFRRHLYALRGYTSLNQYLIEYFGMSRQQAFQRAAVARIIAIRGTPSGN